MGAFNSTTIKNLRNKLISIKSREIIDDTNTLTYIIYNFYS